jgi:hypothetical protein
MAELSNEDAQTICRLIAKYRRLIINQSGLRQVVLKAEVGGVGYQAVATDLLSALFVMGDLVASGQALPPPGDKAGSQLAARQDQEPGFAMAMEAREHAAMKEFQEIIKQKLIQLVGKGKLSPTDPFFDGPLGTAYHPANLPSILGRREPMAIGNSEGLYGPGHPYSYTDADGSRREYWVCERCGTCNDPSSHCVCVPTVTSEVEPPAVSKVEPPAVSKVEPPAVSKVEPPAVSEVET